MKRTMRGLLGVARFGIVAFVLIFAGYLFLVSTSNIHASPTLTLVNWNSCYNNNPSNCVIITPEGNHYISLNITNLGGANITEINITMPAGFSYVAGSNVTTLGIANLVTNVGQNISWINGTNSQSMGLLSLGQSANFTFNLSINNSTGTYTFDLVTKDNGSALNLTQFSVIVQQPVVAGALPVQWNDGSTAPYFWVNLTNTSQPDFFFGDGQVVQMVVNLTSPIKGRGVPGLNITGNFTQIGGSEITYAQDKGSGFYQFNSTINFSAVPGGINMISAASIYIFIRNGTSSNVTLQGQNIPVTQTAGPAPILLVNMTSMPSCPPANHPNAQVPTQMPWSNGTLFKVWTVANCTEGTNTYCSSTNTIGPKQYNNTHVVLCGPSWGADTTNFTQVALTGNFSNVNLVLDVPGKAKINFTGGVDFMGQNGQKAGAIMEFAMKNLMSGGRVGINDSEWDGTNRSGSYKPSMNITARLTIYNLSGLFGLSRDATITFGSFNGTNTPGSLNACNATRCSSVVWDGENMTFAVGTFSTYVTGSVNYTLIWQNMTARSASVYTNQVNTFRVNITNFGNGSPTEMYNLTIINANGVLNDTLFNQSQYGSEYIEFNMSNATAGTYVGYVFARHWNGTATENDINLSSNSDGINFTITVSEPAITISSPANLSNVTASPGLWLNFTNTTLLNTCVFRVNSTATNTTIPSCLNYFLNTSVYNFSQGLNQNITIHANDTFGNGGTGLTMTATAFFNIDSVPPVLSFITPANVANLSGTAVSINATVTDATSGVRAVRFNLTNYTAAALASGNLTLYASNSYSNITLNTTAFPDGRYNITISADDFMGNFNMTTINVTIDNSAPLVTILSPGNVSTNTDVLINLSVSDTFAGVDTVRFNLTNSSGLVQVNLTQVPYAGSGNTYSINLSVGQYGDGPYVLKIIANNTAGVTNSSVSIAFTIDNVAPGLTSWSYSVITKNLTLNFNDTVNPATLTFGTKVINITSQDGTNIESLTTDGTVIGTPNATSVNITLRSVHYERIEAILDTPLQLDMAGGTIKSLGGNNVIQRTNLNISTYTNYGLNIPLTGGSWNTFNLPRTILENTTLSTSGNYSVRNVLSSIENNYLIIYWNDSGTFKSFYPTSLSGNTFTTFLDQDSRSNYWIYMTGTDSLQVQ